jgi:glycosyltransferase involved in cell wall biosynthesis
MRSHRQAIVVLGMHRSGTSVLTRILAELGAATPKSLLGENSGGPDNPSGYFEGRELIELSNRLLGLAGNHWYDDAPMPEGFESWRSTRRLQRRAFRLFQQDFSKNGVFVLKDPRFCRLVPFWMNALENFDADTHWVLILRHPTEVARSLEARDKHEHLRWAAVTAPAQAYLLWLRYTLEAESATRGHSRTILTFEDFLADWRSAVMRIATDAGADLPGLQDEQIIRKMDSLVSPRLRRARREEVSGISHACGSVISVYEALAEHSRGHSPLPVSLLDSVRIELNHSHETFRGIRANDERVRNEDPWGPRQLALVNRRASLIASTNRHLMPTRILFVSGAPQTRGHFYRVENQVKSLRRLGVDASWVPHAMAANHLASFGVIVTYGTPWSDEIASLVAICRDNGIPLGCDVDNLLFDAVTDSRGCSDRINDCGELASGADRKLCVDLRKTLDAADFAIVPNEYIASRVQMAGQRTFVLRHAVDAKTLYDTRRLRPVLKRISIGRMTILGFVGYPPTPLDDLAEAAPAIGRILEKNPNLCFHFAGSFDANMVKDTHAFGNRFRQYGYLNHGSLARLRSRFDINLAPFEKSNPQFHSNSEIEYIEAGIIGIPTIASHSPAFSGVIENRVNGRLASRIDDWDVAISELVERKNIRRRLGLAARRHIENVYGPPAIDRDVKLLYEWVQSECKTT